jgi:hypothetical protein
MHVSVHVRPLMVVKSRDFDLICDSACSSVVTGADGNPRRIHLKLAHPQ